jgi:hypothetical protein
VKKWRRAAADFMAGRTNEISVRKRARNDTALVADDVGLSAFTPPRMQKREGGTMTTSATPVVMDKRARKQMRKEFRKEARKQARREAAKGQGLTVPEYRAAIAVEEVQRAREAGADAATIQKLAKKASARIDALARKLGLPVQAATAAPVGDGASSAASALVKAALPGPRQLVDGTTMPASDPDAVARELTKTLGNPRPGCGGFRS